MSFFSALGDCCRSNAADEFAHSNNKEDSKPGGGGNPKDDNDNGDEGDTNPISVLNFIKGYNNLFDMTAKKHGSSEKTTKQGSRPTVSGNRKRSAVDNNDDERKNSTKRPRTPANSDDPAGGQNNAATFEMMKWEEDDFLQFLKLAGDEMASLMIPKDHKHCKYFDIAMKDSLLSRGITTEHTLDGMLDDRFSELAKVLSLALENKPENKPVYFGKKSEIGIRLPSLGPDNQVDLIFRREHNGADHHALVPWEDKVSWNFPGGRLTSEDEDFAQLGRDVKLYELEPYTEVQSLADSKQKKAKGKNKSTAKLNIANSREGEDEDAVKDAPALRRKHPQRKATAKTAPNSLLPNHGQRIEIGKYKMNHDVFPVRELIAYMISLNSRYAILSTGYRVDFVKLEVEHKGTENERLIAWIAGPLWSVGELHTWVRSENEANLRNDHYYNQIHTYGYEDLRSILQDDWSTNFSTTIGNYSFMEGLLRFLFAASSLPDQPIPASGDYDGSTAVARVGGGDLTTTGQATMAMRSPRSYMSEEEMPQWYGQYMKKDQKRQNDNNVGYVSLCKAGGGQFGFEDDRVKKQYMMGMKEQFQLDWSEHDQWWTEGLTKFGPLSLSELKAGRNTESIGCGRIGEALATTLDTGNIRIAFKLLRQSEWKPEEFDERELELKHEMEIYKKLRVLEGKIIPRFLYAGSIVDASKWLIPEKGEIIAFATSYEGRSLSWYDEDPSRVPEAFEEEEFVDRAVMRLQAIHNAGVLHGDLELRNIVYSDGTDDVYNQIKFVDFGNAEFFSVETQSDRFRLACDKELETLKALLHVFQTEPDESDVDSSETSANVESENDEAAFSGGEAAEEEEIEDDERPESAPPRS